MASFGTNAQVAESNLKQNTDTKHKGTNHIARSEVTGKAAKFGCLRRLRNNQVPAIAMPSSINSGDAKTS
jgi:hypothetical protein